MWAQVKGRTESALLVLFPCVYVPPGGAVPDARRSLEDALERISYIARDGAPKRLLENRGNCGFRGFATSTIEAISPPD